MNRTRGTALVVVTHSERLASAQLVDAGVLRTDSARM
jgi:hypothetical protein